MINFIQGLSFFFILFQTFNILEELLKKDEFLTLIDLNERILYVIDFKKNILFQAPCGIGRGNKHSNPEKRSDFDRITPQGLFKITDVFKLGDEELKKLNNIFWPDLYKTGEPIGKNAYGDGFVAFDWTEPLDREKPKKTNLSRGQFRRGKEYNFSLFSLGIHGTNRDDWVGIPSTGGCIRLKNSDIKIYIEKFAKIKGLIYIKDKIEKN